MEECRGIGGLGMDATTGAVVRAFGVGALVGLTGVLGGLVSYVTDSMGVPVAGPMAAVILVMVNAMVAVNPWGRGSGEQLRSHCTVTAGMGVGAAITLGLAGQLLPWGVALLAVGLVAAGMGMWESRRRGGAQGT